MKIYLLRIAAWLSQGINCILLFGHHDVTVSARLYLNREKPLWRQAYYVVNAMFYWQDDHCRNSWLADIHWANEVLADKMEVFRKIQNDMFKG